MQEKCHQNSDDKMGCQKNLNGPIGNRIKGRKWILADEREADSGTGGSYP